MEICRHEEPRWIGDLGKASIRHLEDADFIGRPEAIFDGPQHAILMAAIAFEIEHCVDHVVKVRGMLNAVMRHCREDIEKVAEPNAQTLFETTAEVLRPDQCL